MTSDRNSSVSQRMQTTSWRDEIHGKAAQTKESRATAYLTKACLYTLTLLEEEAEVGGYEYKYIFHSSFKRE